MTLDLTCGRTAEHFTFPSLPCQHVLSLCAINLIDLALLIFFSVQCSFATSDGQSYVATAVQPAAGAPQGIQHVLLPSPTVLSQAAPGGATAVRCAIPIQGVTPLSPPAATMTTYTCPIPGQQQPLAMTGVRPVLVPAAPAAAAGAAPGVSSPVRKRKYV